MLYRIATNSFQFQVSHKTPQPETDDGSYISTPSMSHHSEPSFEGGDEQIDTLQDINLIFGKGKNKNVKYSAPVRYRALAETGDVEHYSPMRRVTVFQV